MMGLFGAYNPPPMVSRLRIVVAAALLIAIAAHPLAHPLFKECPCIHAVAAAVAESCGAAVVVLAAGRFDQPAAPAFDSPEHPVRASRAPPAA